MAARDFFEVMKGLAPDLDNLGPKISAELSTLSTQGAREMAQAIIQWSIFYTLRTWPVHAHARVARRQPGSGTAADTGTGSWWPGNLAEMLK